ncbi:RNA-directed DNA polymerase, eukaryota, reverse transcriptase zinc-binding domain protein, partial [Tanacetum coccineum]
MIKWVMSCVSSTSFTINVNGDHNGFFKGMRGLRQGDPLSPYLFTLIMEVLNLILKIEIDRSSSFRYHWQCKEVKLTRLCFADDLLMFCNGDSASVVVINKALMEFGGMSGLLPNIAKSKVFFVFWASMFILPVSISNEIERLMRDFLLNFGIFKRGKAKVSWKSICKPKVEGGLGIKALDSWNIALMSKHVRNIVT